MTFNPDDLALTKPEIMDLIDETVNEFKNNKKVRAAGLVLKTFVTMSKKEDIENLWNTLTLKINRLTIKNSLKHAELEGEDWAKTFKKIEDSKKNDN